VNGADDAPVRFFRDLYAVVVGVGMAFAAEQIVDLKRRGVPIRWEHVPLFVAWIAIAIPFAHTAVRYIDFIHERWTSGEPFRRAFTVGNIVFGAGHFMWLIALAFFVTRPFVFGYGVVIFLGGVAVQAAVLHLHPRGWLHAVEARANVIQAGCVAALLVVLLIAQFGLEGAARPWVARIGILAIGIAYPTVLYVWAFELFFPDQSVPGAG